MFLLASVPILCLALVLAVGSARVFSDTSFLSFSKSALKNYLIAEVNY